MASQTKITITHDKENTIDVQNQLIVNAMTNKMQVECLQVFLEQIEVGGRNATIATVIDDGNAVAATGTVTFTGINTANDTLVISGVTFTAVASGATGNQWNVGTTASTQAANVASAINAASSLSGVVTAAAVGAVVTVTASVAGLLGNAVTLAKGTDAGAVMTVGGLTNGRLGGGTAATNSSSVTYKFGV